MKPGRSGTHNQANGRDPLLTFNYSSDQTDIHLIW